MSTQPMVQLPMRVIEQIQEGLRLTPGTWTALAEAVERAKSQTLQERVDQQTRLDAARYRRIRSGGDQCGDICIIRFDGDEPGDCTILTDDNADAEIDALI